jgi:hypothetical protein
MKVIIIIVLVLIFLGAYFLIAAFGESDKIKIQSSSPVNKNLVSHSLRSLISIHD